MSRFTEALELARAGFKATEIRRMWEDENNEPNPQKEPEPKKDQDSQKETDPPAGDPGPTAEEADPEQDTQREDPQPDLKYQELEKKYNDLLKKYQQNNVRQDISGNNEEKTVEEAATDVLAAMIGG